MHVEYISRATCVFKQTELAVEEIWCELRIIIYYIPLLISPIPQITSIQLYPVRASQVRPVTL